jgi:hypothetical protein
LSFFKSALGYCLAGVVVENSTYLCTAIAYLQLHISIQSGLGTYFLRRWFEIKKILFFVKFHLGMYIAFSSTQKLAERIFVDLLHTYGKNSSTVIKCVSFSQVKWQFFNTCTYTYQVDKCLGRRMFGSMNAWVNKWTGLQMFMSMNIWVDKYLGWQIFGLTNIRVNKSSGWRHFVLWCRSTNWRSMNIRWRLWQKNIAPVCR